MAEEITQEIIQEIVKETSQVYSQTLWYKPYGALAALITAIVTTAVAVFLYLQTRELQKQTQSLKIQEENKVRPWIKLHPLKLESVEYSDGNIESSPNGNLKYNILNPLRLCILQ